VKVEQFVEAMLLKSHQSPHDLSELDLLSERCNVAATAMYDDVVRQLQDIATQLRDTASAVPKFRVRYKPGKLSMYDRSSKFAELILMRFESELLVISRFPLGAFSYLHVLPLARPGEEYSHTTLSLSGGSIESYEMEVVDVKNEAHHLFELFLSNALQFWQMRRRH
jgi:hypothetical protein